MSPHGRADMQDETALHARLRELEQENARLLEEQWTRLQETRALTGIGRLLSERLDPDVVGERIAESLRSLLGGGSAVVYRLDDDSANLLAMAVAHGPADADRGLACGARDRIGRGRPRHARAPYHHEPGRPRRRADRHSPGPARAHGAGRRPRHPRGAAAHPGPPDRRARGAHRDRHRLRRARGAARRRPWPTRPRSPSSTRGSSRRRSGGGARRRCSPTWPARSAPRPSSPPCSVGSPRPRRSSAAATAR